MKIIIKTYDGWTPFDEMRYFAAEIADLNVLTDYLKKFDIHSISYHNDTMTVYVWNKGKFWPIS